jgi:membrane-associated phospholipid phosphatase
VARSGRTGLDLKPGPFFKAAASRLDLRSRRGFPVTVAGAVAAVSFLGFLSIAENVVGTAPLGLDKFASDAVAAMANPVCTAVMWIATLMGDVRVMIVETAVAAVTLALWGHPRRAGSVVLLVVTGVWVSETLKGVVTRMRPDAALAMIAGEGAARSFPSGHALAGILLFGSLALMLGASRVPRPLRLWGGLGLAAVGLTIGLSRVYLGVHYLSDVLASWLLGLTMLSAWAAAVLVWGRTRPPLTERVVRPWVRLWWRWTLGAAGAAAVVIAIVAETGITPLR